MFPSFREKEREYERFQGRSSMNCSVSPFVEGNNMNLILFSQFHRLRDNQEIIFYVM